MTASSAGAQQPGAQPPGAQQPGASRPGDPQTLDSASAALSGADPQSLHRSGQRFTATAEQLRRISDEFRGRLRELEGAWNGPGAQAFAEATTGITHRLDGLVSTLSSPDYGWLCRELGDALATGQRELQQLRDERASQPSDAAPPQAGTAPASGVSAAPPAGAPPAGSNQVSPQDDRAGQIMHELSNAYRQLGGQLHALPGKVPGTPRLRQVAHSATGSVHLDEASAPDAGGRSAVESTGAQHGGGTAAPLAGGVLGKHQPEDRAQESTADRSMPVGALGRPESATTRATAFALTAGTLGRAHRGRSHNHLPTDQMADAEIDQPGVLGNPARTVPTQPEHVQHQQTQHQQTQRQQDQGQPEQHERTRQENLDADSPSGQQDAAPLPAQAQTAEPAPPPVAPPPPATTSATPAPPPEGNAAPLPNCATANTTAASASADQPTAAQAPLHGLPAAVPTQHATGPDPHVSTASAGAPTPPQPARADPAPAKPGPLPPAHPHEPDTTIPPENTAGGGGAPASTGDERSRNTWTTERSTTWRHDDRSGVLGR